MNDQLQGLLEWRELYEGLQKSGSLRLPQQKCGCTCESESHRRRFADFWTPFGNLCGGILGVMKTMNIGIALTK